jgi:RNA-directed DNA polymerase
LLRGYPGDCQSPALEARDELGATTPKIVARDKTRWITPRFFHYGVFAGVGFPDTQMPPLDPLRFVYSLAGRLIAQPWTLPALKKSLRPSAFELPLRVPKLADRILEAYPSLPNYGELIAFLRTDNGLLRALARASLTSQLVPKLEQLPSALQNLGLPTLDSEAALAGWFGLDVHHLRWFADISGRNRSHRDGPLRTYRYRWIPRRQGLPRLLEIPKLAIKQMQRKILDDILNLVPVHDAVHGFRRSRSILTNAIVHCQKPVVLRFDLTDFFPSVSSARVFRIFRTIGYPAAVSRLLMGICTTSLPADVWDARPGARLGADFLARQRLITRHLPQGAPTSPALANLAANRLDRRLASLAHKVDVGYTRYADDLTFSGDGEFARGRKRFATLVAVIADDEGFAMNHRKTRLMRAGVCQHVTGVVVNARPNIRRVEFDRLKAILTNCVRHGPSTQNRSKLPDFRSHLSGKVSHVGSLHPARGEKLRILLEKIEWQK